MEKSSEEYLLGVLDTLREVTSHTGAGCWSAMIRSTETELRKIRARKAMLRSLEDSIEAAGGSTNSLMKKVHGGMSVIELCDVLAPNGVTFTHPKVAMLQSVAEKVTR